MRGSRIVLLVVGVVLVAIGLGAAGAAAMTGWAHLLQRDDEGFVTSPSVELASDGHAVVSENLEVVVGPADWFPWNDEIDLRLRVTPLAAGRPVFVGLAPTDDVTRYLDDVAHDRVASLGVRSSRFVEVSGTTAPAPPAGQAFWLAATEGPGTQTLAWSPRTGEWTIAVMNADGSAGVDVRADAGVQTALLGPIAAWLFVGALVLLGLGATLIVLAVHEEPRRPAPGAAGPPPVPVETGTRVHPVALSSHLDARLSRGLWLVKWLLLIPHLFALVVLWTAFVVLTVVAAFAILVTDRYPRSLFEFNLGVLRWTWRVGFYGYSALGTDRYPPFTLDDVDYPARLDVAYPQHLSRGLVLVKSWLLALPHLLIVAVLVGDWARWSVDPAGNGTSWRISLAGGLIGLLALVAGLVLLFTARYPAGLFDLLMGCNRWVYRVIAYVALMTDTYPPFRLDLGGDEPPDPAPPGPASPAGHEGARPEPVGTGH